MATSGQPLPPPLPKKISPLVWIVVGVFGFVVLAGIAMIAGGLFLAKQVSDASGNPALAAAKILAMTNPDVEVVSSDDSRGTVTIREKSTGKVLTLDFNRIKEGKLSFEQDGKKVTVDSSSEGLDFKGDDGSSVRVGAQSNATLPSWLPAYPGAAMHGAFSLQGATESGAAVSFTTKDPAEKVSTFYQDVFKTAGLTTSVNLLSEGGKTEGGIITAESADKKRSAVVNMHRGMRA
jgi:hypothetical protein